MLNRNTKEKIITIVQMISVKNFEISLNQLKSNDFSSIVYVLNLA